MTRKSRKLLEQRHFDLFRELLCRQFHEELPDPDHRTEPDLPVLS
jgi:hypothetical protein